LMSVLWRECLQNMHVENLGPRQSWWDSLLIRFRVSTPSGIFRDLFGNTLVSYDSCWIRTWITGLNYMWFPSTARTSLLGTVA
jgi:hypothetical protein